MWDCILASHISLPSTAFSAGWSQGRLPPVGTTSTSATRAACHARLNCQFQVQLLQLPVRKARENRHVVNLPRARRWRHYALRPSC